METYWKSGKGQGGTTLQFPFVRFKVKNIGESPLTYVYVNAAFEDVDKKEAIGTAISTAISITGLPLKPGYKIEVSLECSTGLNEWRPAKNLPAIAVDLYFETSNVARMKILKRMLISKAYNSGK